MEALAVELGSRIVQLGHAAAEYRRAALAQWSSPRLQAPAAAAVEQFAPQLSSLPPSQLADVSAHLWAASAMMSGAGWRRLHVRLESCRPSGKEAPELPAVAPALACACWEQLLCAYDLPQRRARSVYVTPPELVDFLVRAADSLLQTSLNLPAGLAHDGDGRRLRVVDPAAGCGPFLLRAARQIVERASASQVRRSLLGFECLAGSAAVANGLLAHATPPPARTPMPEIVRWADALRQTDPLSWFDHGRPVLAVIGNPPYANYGRRNRSPWILHQLRAYKRGLAERKHNLDDDFVKFWRWAEHHVQRAGEGVVAMVTSSTYLRGLTHRVMRQSLLRTFGQALVLDLHGEQFQASSNAACLDENVFDIRQGVAIGLFVKRRGDGLTAPGPSEQGPPCEVFHAELRGSREAKLRFLSERGLSDVNWRRISPQLPLCRFCPTPRATRRYDSWLGLDQLFLQFISGVQSKCDAFFIDRNRQRLAARMQAAIACPAERQGLPQWLQPRLDGAHFDKRHLRRCIVAPLDDRWIYYDSQLLGRARHQVLRNMEPGDRAFVFMRQSTNAGPYDHFLICNRLATDRVFHSRHGAPYVAPWSIRSDGRPRLNVSRAAWRLLGREPRDDDPPEDVLFYVAAVTHSREYRRRFEERLQADFPRIPPCHDRSMFEQLAALGRLLAARLCGEDSSGGDSPHDRSVVLAGEGSCEVARGFPRASAAASPNTDVWINPQQAWRLPAAAWNWRVGGVPVLRHWLAARRGESLTDSEQRAFARMVSIGQAALQLQDEIDDVLQSDASPLAQAG